MNSPLKNGQKMYAKVLVQRELGCCRFAHERMANILRHWRNAHQNYNKHRLLPPSDGHSR